MTHPTSPWSSLVGDVPSADPPPTDALPPGRGVPAVRELSRISKITRRIVDAKDRDAMALHLAAHMLELHNTVRAGQVMAIPPSDAHHLDPESRAKYESLRRDAIAESAPMIRDCLGREPTDEDYRLMGCTAICLVEAMMHNVGSKVDLKSKSPAELVSMLVGLMRGD